MARSRRAIAELGVGTTIMLSGDNERVAKAIAGSVGISEVRAPLLPDGKVDAIRKLTDTHGVAMIGDGVNDAPALAAASVGVAMVGTRRRDARDRRRRAARTTRCTACRSRSACRGAPPT